MIYVNVSDNLLRFDIAGQKYIVKPGAQCHIADKYEYGVIKRGLCSSRKGPLKATGERDAAEPAPTDVEFDEKAPSDVCMKCGELPCSVECFVKAGYKAENFEAFVAAHKSEKKQAPSPDAVKPPQAKSK